MSLSKSELVGIRDMVSDDRSFIFATFLRGLFYGDSWFSRIKKSIFMANYHQVVEKLITDPRNTVKVACLKDDPEIILGYAIYNEFNLHWVFVKKSWREIGIAKNLVPSNVETVTHLTKVGLSILIQKYPRADFNPFNL